MLKIFIADIFGRTPELEDLTYSIGGEFDIIDPYDGRLIDFADESEAYIHFMDSVGLNRYCNILMTKLKSVETPTLLIGFSVGASALWKILDNLNAECITSVICFYGSQIRYHQNVVPSVPVEFVVPKFEPGFNIDKFAQNMSKKSNVNIYKTNFLHGFMNSLSKNFNHGGYKEYIEWICANSS